MTIAVRKKKISMIKMAQKQLAIPDDAYRAMLQRISGQNSCTCLSIAQLDKVLDEMIKKGFKIKPKNPSYSAPVKTPTYVQSDERDKVLSMWIALADIGVVKNRSDHALARYCYKITGKQHWHFEADYMPIIEGLKGWYYREALKLLCAKLEIADIMYQVHLATQDQRISSKYKNAKTVNQISSAMAENTFYYIAERFQIADPVAYIKQEVDNGTTKTARSA